MSTLQDVRADDAQPDADSASRRARIPTGLKRVSIAHRSAAASV
jgi:hypothetical protein